MLESTKNTPRHQETQSPEPAVRVWALAGEIGLLVVVPLIVLLLIGIRIDRLADTTPLFIVIGLILAFTTSIIAIARKIKRIQDIQP